MKRVPTSGSRADGGVGKSRGFKAGTAVRLRNRRKPKLPNKSPGRKLPGRLIPPHVPTESFSRPGYRTFALCESASSVRAYFASEWVSGVSPQMISAKTNAISKLRWNMYNITASDVSLNNQYGSLGGGVKGGVWGDTHPSRGPLDYPYCILGVGTEVMASG